MDKKHIVLKLLFDGLGEIGSIASIEDRKIIQKSIYMSQLFGPNLGYRFGWHVMGPYSPELATDYYDLQNELDAGDVDYKNKKFSEPILEALKRAQQAMRQPDGSIEFGDWVETIASIHHLLIVQKKSKAQAKRRFEIQKANLLPYFDKGFEHLDSLGLLQAKVG